ncbi:hypothetical protein O0555_17655 [Brevibacillus laterosporus]|uniref:hypothetical protein n=1 Tax=Brevibacillus laterosporus TaxID=1465 RepID=UPI00215C62CE|nr:hypothetical protein [Brevibacillus laterosporus]MCR8939159.1 hypothetical protein [Brevibacillus laterosporus]MCZ0841799.1 hypothetical protein [Brevibacillus laterosporus]MCZ0843742.1 hypothetical protein [Brevibacillus laterosporus]
MKKIFCLLLSLLFVLSGCQGNQTTEESKHMLNIGVVGTKPSVNEENVQFIELTLNMLVKDENIALDALFIMPEMLQEASKKPYKSIYKAGKYPIYFVDSESSYLPFTEEDMTYESAPKIKDGMYIMGILKGTNKEVIKFRGYGLKDDKKTTKNIKEVYSTVFLDITTEKYLK